MGEQGDSRVGTRGDRIQRASPQSARVSRRGALGLLGLGVLGVSGGCSRLLADSETTAPPTTTGSPDGQRPGVATAETSEQSVPYPEQRHVAVTDVAPELVQYNPVNPEHASTISHHVLFEPLAKYTYVDDTFRPAAATAWTLADGTFEVTLRGDLVWTDGEPVDADDLATQLRIARHVGDPLWEWATGVRTPDDRTVAIDGTDGVNPSLVERAVFAGRFVRMDKRTYGPYLTALEDGADLDALRSFADTDPVTCGPFRLAVREPTTLVTERFESHPDADAINFGEYAFRRLTASEQPSQALLEKTIDSHHDLVVEQEIAEQFPDTVRSVHTPAVFGFGLVPDHSHEHAGDRPIRQAIAAVVDRSAIVPDAFESSKRTPPVPTGLATGVQAAWLGDAIDDFDGYGPRESLSGTAATRLRNAGYRRRDGVWRDSAGSVVSLPITVPGNWLDWRLAADAVAQQLSAFGFDTSVVERTDYADRLERGEFVLAAASWLHGGPTQYPDASLRHLLWEPTMSPLESRTVSIEFGYPGAREGDSVGGAAAPVTVPARDGSGDMTVDLAERLQALATATTATRITRIVRDLAWVANRDLPMIPLMEHLDRQLLTVDTWAVPADLDADPDANVRWAPTWLPRTGKLSYDG